MVSFKGAQFPRDVNLHAVFFYVRYAVSYRDLEEILAASGIQVDYATLNHWVVKYASALAKAAQKRKMSTALSWRLDETYVKVRLASSFSGPLWPKWWHISRPSGSAPHGQPERALGQNLFQVLIGNSVTAV